MRNRLCGLGLLFAACVLAQTTYLTQQPGVWKPWKMSAVPSARAEQRVTPVELRAFEGKLIELSEFVRRVPGIGQPVGFSVETSGYLTGYRQAPGGPAGDQVPLMGGTNFGALSIYEFQRNGKTVRMDTGETYLLTFHVNNLPLFHRSKPVEWGQTETDAILLPAPTGSVAGFPILAGNLVVKKNPSPLTVPLALGQALQLVQPERQRTFDTAGDALARQRAELTEWQSAAKRAERKKGYRETSALLQDGGKFVLQMEGQEGEIEAVMRANVAPDGPAAKSVQEAETALNEVRAALVALSPAEASGPGCYDQKGATLREKLRPAGGAGCVPLVRLNWAYFDARLPRSAPQLLLVGGYENCLNSRESTEGKPWGCAANRKVLEGLDWKAVMEWMDR